MVKTSLLESCNEAEEDRNHLLPTFCNRLAYSASGRDFDNLIFNRSSNESSKSVRSCVRLITTLTPTPLLKICLKRKLNPQTSQGRRPYERPYAGYVQRHGKNFVHKCEINPARLT